MAASLFIIMTPENTPAQSPESQPTSKPVQSEADLVKTAPWEVFMDETIARKAMDQESEAVKTLPKGSKFPGKVLTDEDTNIEWIEVKETDPAYYVLRCHVYRVHPVNRQEGNIEIGTEIVNRWWALPLDYEPDDLQDMPMEYRSRKDRPFQLRKEAMESIINMLEAAKADGVIIKVNSAYRSGEYQTGLYTRAISRNGCEQRYSAPPGHSEHQLGTCVDLTDPDSEFAFTEEFKSTPQGLWLEANAAKFGFIRSYYPENVEETGYISEPWHWRYKGISEK